MPLLSNLWKSPDESIQLTQDTAHVWCAELDYSPEVIAAFFNLLSSDEQTRAKRFRFLKDQNHFIAARAILRKILSRYLQISPQKILFDYLVHGKPVVANGSLQFNLSHSKDIALYAITKNYPVGIDIEYLSQHHAIEKIAKRFFSAGEHHVLQSLQAEKKLSAFYNGWTRKEAFLKAIGEGLSYPLSKVEVTLREEDPPAFVFLHDKENEISEWHLHALAPIANYASALAVKGKLKEILMLRWDRDILFRT